MLFKFHLTALIMVFFLLNNLTTAAPLSSVSKSFETETLPLASFLFAQRDQMRVGWYNNTYKYDPKNLRTKGNKVVGSLFVQLRPRKFEGEYQLALRILRDGSHQFQLIREFTNSQPLNHKRYLTIPFEYLIGAIQGEALRALFPNDRVEFGGWRHQITYEWETPDLITKSFTKSTKYFLPKQEYKQGETFTIPWDILRADLELKPLAVRKPLFIKKDESGLRYAFYRIQSGETIYSSVVSRFIGETKHYVRIQNTSDLLALNKLENAHNLSIGQLIKIPLEWIRPEYLHQVPGIYRTSKDLNGEPKESESKSRISHETTLPQKEKLYRISIISKR
ncbi:MAG: LysM domain-containing protein [SAR324 cluster bacterium]|nr:LysM domain-containing protein [SAR324 cluster bacterium]